MILPDDEAIERIACGLIDRTLPKAEWTHVAHFAAALWVLRHRPAMAGAEAFKDLIVRYNEATGTPNTDEGGYHHTITIASLRAAAHHLQRSPPKASLAATLAELMASPLGRSDWLLQHWERSTLFSVPARRTWVEPDRAPLPF